MNILYCWICDYSKDSGEGNLARLFLDKKKITHEVKCFTPNNFKIRSKLIFNIINCKYISPFVGILFCWHCFFNKKKILFLNYLPLWNIFIFILLPPQTQFGPITGGANYKKGKFYFIRNYIFPRLYKISEFFIFLRAKKIIFSTDLLIPYLNKKTILISEFNFILKMKKKIINFKKDKDIDFFIYYRKHSNKENFFPYNFIKKLISLNYKIHIVGDNLNCHSVINHGHISNEYVKKFLLRTRYTISSDENLYSVFTMECLNSHVQIIVSKKMEHKIKLFKKKFIIVDYDKIYDLINLRSSRYNPITQH